MKKSFTGGLNTILGETPKKKFYLKGGSPTTIVEGTSNIIKKTSQKGLLQGEIRATFIVKEDLLEQVKALSYWERSKIKEVINRALLGEITRYKNKNGEIKNIPK